MSEPSIVCDSKFRDWNCGGRVLECDYGKGHDGVHHEAVAAGDLTVPRGWRDQDELKCESRWRPTPSPDWRNPQTYVCAFRLGHTGKHASAPGAPDNCEWTDRCGYTRRIDGDEKVCAQSINHSGVTPIWGKEPIVLHRTAGGETFFAEGVYIPTPPHDRYDREYCRSMNPDSVGMRCQFQMGHESAHGFVSGNGIGFEWGSSSDQIGKAESAAAEPSYQIHRRDCARLRGIVFVRANEPGEFGMTYQVQECDCDGMQFAAKLKAAAITCAAAYRDLLGPFEDDEDDEDDEDES